MVNGYWKPETVDEALALKAGHKGSRFLAGGTELERLGCAVEAKGLIDVKALGFDGIRRERDGLHVGSMVTFTQALESDLVPNGLKEALRFMGSLPKRNMATIGGNVMRHGSDSYLLPTLAAYHAGLVFVADSAQETAVEIEQLIRHPAEWEHGLLKEIVLDPKRQVSSRRFAITRESHAAVTLSLGCKADGNDLRMAAAVRGAGVQLFARSQERIAGGAGRNEFHAALEGELETADDLTGSAEYKRYLVEEGLWMLVEAMRRDHV